MSTRRRILLWGGAAAALAFIFAAIFTVTWMARDSRQDLSLSYFDPDERDASDAVHVTAFDGLRDETPRLCAGVEGCIEGYGATHTTFYRFATKEQAASFASSREDAYQSDWIVIDYDGTSLSPADRSLVEEVIDGTWTSD